MGNGAGKSKQVRRHVRIMMPDGNFLVLGCPVEVSEVMVGYPNHMVVHCETNADDPEGDRSKITIMHPDQVLEPDEEYILHLVPPQYRKVVFKTLSQPSPSAIKRGKKPKHKVLRLLSKHNLTAFFPKHSGAKDEKGRHASALAALINSEGNEPEVCVFMGWQPTLEGIPECGSSDEEDLG